LKEFAAQFDKVELDRLYLDKSEIEELASSISREQQRALEIAFQNIHRFHSTQLKRERVTETMPGVKDRKSTRLNSSHVKISYAVLCLKKKKASETNY